MRAIANFLRGRGAGVRRGYAARVCGAGAARAQRGRAARAAAAPAPRLTERTAAERAAAELAATVVAAELAAAVVVAERPLGLARGRSPDAGSSTSGPSRIYCEKTCSARARYANQLFSNARMSR